MIQGRHYQRHGKRRLEGFIPVGGLLLWVGLLASAFFSYQKPPSGNAATVPPREHASVVQQQAIKPDPHPLPARPADDRAADEAQDLAENDTPGETSRQAAPSDPSATARPVPESVHPAAPARPAAPASPEPVPRAGPPAQAVTDASAPPARSPSSPSPAEDAASTPASENVVKEPSSPHVADAQFTSGIENREPIDRVGKVFHTRGKPYRRLYYFTRITGLSGETVTHRWEYKGQVMAKVSFHIGSSSWRVYSSKHLTSSLTGRWRVVVTDSDGHTLKTDSFVYANP